MIATPAFTSTAVPFFLTQALPFLFITDALAIFLDGIVLLLTDLPGWIYSTGVAVFQDIRWFVLALAGFVCDPQGHGQDPCR